MKELAFGRNVRTPTHWKLLSMELGLSSMIFVLLPINTLSKSISKIKKSMEIKEGIGLLFLTK